MLNDKTRLLISARLRRSLSALQAIADELPRLQRVMNKWERGGFPGSSIPECISSSGENSPSWDKMDRDMHAHVERFLRDSRDLENTVVPLWDLMSSYLRLAGILEEEERFPCANVRCTNWVRKGEKTCSRCRVHKHTHGREWPVRRDGSSLTANSEPAA